ncbi:MAG: hydrolase 2, exosortase A system-associated [Casimicrobiaceae bacterium]
MARATPFFLSVGNGRRFGLLHRAAAESRQAGAILYVHPLAEEMNKARRVAAVQAGALAKAGWTVLLLDLFGCGDSEGDFRDAGWKQWLADVRAAREWLRAETGMAPVLWGLRAGALLAANAAREMHPAPDLVLWQPVFSGKQLLQQFLRLRVAGQLTGSSAGDRVGTEHLRAQLGRGEVLEVAGYEVSRDLASGMEASELVPPSEPIRIELLEVSVSEETGLSPAATQRLDRWRTAGHRVNGSSVHGLPFWQTQEIAECPLLIDATLRAIGMLRR